MYQLGIAFTVVVFIISIFLILMNVSNCITYAYIRNHPDTVDFSQGWANFLFAMSIFGAILGFILFFWIIYIWVTGKRTGKNTIGENEITRKLATYGPGKFGNIRDPDAHRSFTTIENLKESYRDETGRDLTTDYPDIKYRCSDGNNKLFCPEQSYGGDQNDATLNNLARAYVSNNLRP
jgi:hypothetical protein